MKNDLHQKVFDFLATFRNLNPNFYYYFRERNAQKRFDEGLWFPGTNTYAFVGLYNAEGGTTLLVVLGSFFTKTMKRLDVKLKSYLGKKKIPCY